MDVPVTVTAEEGRTDAASPFYIPATSTPTYRARTLKYADTFLVLDPFGDAQAMAPSAEGLFHQDTRYLSRLILLIAERRPLLLSSTATDDNMVLAVDLTNPDLFQDGSFSLPRNSVHILRTKVLAPGACCERLKIRNYGQSPVELPVALMIEVDFADIFEVRGMHRAHRGTMLDATLIEDGLILGYRGLDGIVRRTLVQCDPVPNVRPSGRLDWTLKLDPGETRSIFVTVQCEYAGRVATKHVTYVRALHETQLWIQHRKESVAGLYSSNAFFNHWINRSQTDLDMLMTETPHGLYAYAGIPWFSTAFGRDGLITALQCLWLDPQLARGTLSYLAATQAGALMPEADAEPGKILHETRKGEMAALGEVPFGQYYGSVDSTPLFVVLAAAYHDRTGDTEFIRAIWPSVEAALAWMKTYGDLDGDGFLDYDRRSVNGLTNQGWKDSVDSIFHEDGTLAAAPISLAEVQSYAYGAYRGAARLAGALGDPWRAHDLAAEAALLRERFEAAFWCEDLGTYALALDGSKRPCRVRTSNAGHALLSGMATPERAARVAATLMQPVSFNGWGIRTVCEGEARYNPMSYHNGSVWPHDNGLIGMGFGRYGFRDQLLRLLTGMLDASLFVDLNRLPELFCGFERRQGEGPTPYPVACLPQAWASATVFGLVGAMLGISFDAALRQIRLYRPVMPPWLDELTVQNLRLGDARVDLLFRRYAHGVTLNVLRKDDGVEVLQVS